MAPRRRQLQSRLSRSARMRGATVKRAVAAQPDDGSPREPRRSGIQYVGPSPAIDAVLSDVPSIPVRQILTALGSILGALGLVTLVVVFMLRKDGEPILTPATVQFLWMMAAVALVSTIIYTVARWLRMQSAVSRLSAEERRAVLATGSLRIQARNAGIGSPDHWLMARGSDWMMLEPVALAGLEPLMMVRPEIDGPFDRQTGTDVLQEWTIPRATILYHRAARVIIELHDDQGGLVYRHPRYLPSD